MKRADEELNGLLQEYEQNAEKFNNIQKTIKLLKGFMKTIERFPEREKQSEIDKKLLLIMELTWIGQLDKVSGNREIIGEYKREIEVEVTVKAHEENYEQLALPGCETEQGEVRKVKKKVSVGLFRGNKYYRKVKPERTMNEILTDHSKHSRQIIINILEQASPPNHRKRRWQMGWQNG